jgi:hypothetical protein
VEAFEEPVKVYPKHRLDCCRSILLVLPTASVALAGTAPVVFDASPACGKYIVDHVAMRVEHCELLNLPR